MMIVDRDALAFAGKLFEWLADYGVPHAHDRAEVIARSFVNDGWTRAPLFRDPATLADDGDLGLVCDAYGLPHDAVALARHLTSNAALTIEVNRLAAALSEDPTHA